MDLNASPLPDEDDDNNFIPRYNNNNNNNAPPQQQPLVVSAAETARREREERKMRLKRERPDNRRMHVSQHPLDDDHHPAKHFRTYDQSKLPQGWLNCPPFGQEISCIVPSKVPLGESFYNNIPPGKRYSFNQVFHQQRALGRNLGLVIDLTNTSRYYGLHELRNGVKHTKIKCKGRDSVPDNLSVNKFVYAVIDFISRQRQQKSYILVHCTHGHNRTGFMIVHYLMRSQPMSVTQAIKIFADARPPGIYKPDYIDALYTFYHEKKPEIVCPPTPEWKRSPDLDLNGEALPDEDDDGGDADIAQEDHVVDARLTNDDVLGDEIPPEQLHVLQQFCYRALKMNFGGGGKMQFPGSHPVSLNRENLKLLRRRYYYATWKADGTRYMMLITTNGCFLIDRSFNFRRVQMRFPCKFTHEGGKGLAEKTHHFTLLDGEMVIDTVPETQKQERRYLIYDMMALNSISLIEHPFYERFKMVQEEVIEPRNLEKRLNTHYSYDLEPFRVRRKNFWLLSTVDKLLKNFIRDLSHEADGLIFQGWEDPYVPRTHEGLLKWKYASMNSVDFLFEIDSDGRNLLSLFERGKKKPMDGNSVSFGDEDPSVYSGKIIECSWNSEEEVWRFMRIRTDKTTPNDINTYRKVMRSIKDNITEEFLFNEIYDTIRLPMYAEKMKSDSKPRLANGSNKFREREAVDDSNALPQLDENDLLNTQCPSNLQLRWQTEVSSSIYATPLIADINSDGKLDVVVSSFVHYLEVLEGSDGDKMPGWPAFHQSTVHASPLLYDIDKDGVREIALATFNGEVLFFRVSGYIMTEKLVVPRLRVRKDWYTGLKPQHEDRSHPDVHDDQLILEAAEMQSMSQPNNGKNILDAAENHPIIANITNSDSERKISETQPTVNITETHDRSERKINETQPAVNITETLAENNSTESQTETNIKLPTNTDNSSASTQSAVTDNAASRTNSARRLLEDNNANVGISTVENDEGLEQDADSSFDLLRENADELADEYNYDYDDYINDALWGDEEWREINHEKIEDYVNVDAHILSTPVIADIDNDGIPEMIVAVSHFFDHEYYDKAENSKELGDIDIGKYVAGAIVVFNLDTKQVKWSTQLDLSTDTANYRAYIYSSPTVADLDGDGNLDILVGTSFGMFYVLDHHGKVREKFPLEMAEIQASAIAADINDDGKLELVTADTHGNVAAWSTQGVMIWEQHVKSLVPQRPSIGDIDGDGHTDVVVPTVSGNIYVLSGKDGSFVRPYPYRTHGRVMNQVLLVDLTKRGEKSKGLTMVTTSFDGYVYLIDGPSSCADVVDIGETSYSMVLADNVDGGDDLDLIVTTMNGNVFCFSTPAPHHPLKAWRSSYQGRNNIANRYGREGVYVTHPSRAFRDEEGKSFWVEIEIVDKYRYPSGSQAPYNVTVSLLVPGNYQGERTIKQNHIFDAPGKHLIRLPTVGVRTTGTVLVEMVDKNRLYFSDEFSLTFHMHYYKLLKWFLVLPMLGMFFVLVILRPQEAVPLPSFSRNTDL
ncbi:hypothetical protein ACFE04_016061 [Oxalis oulophora]